MPAVKKKIIKISLVWLDSSFIAVSKLLISFFIEFDDIRFKVMVFIRILLYECSGASMVVGN